MFPAAAVWKSTMVINRSFLWTVFVWIILSFLLDPVSSILRYSVDELLQLRLHTSDPPLVLHLHPDLVRHQRHKYVHRGSGWRFNIGDSKPIKSFWSSSPRPPRKHHPAVDRGVLADLARSARATALSLSGEQGSPDLRSFAGKQIWLLVPDWNLAVAEWLHTTKRGCTTHICLHLSITCVKSRRRVAMLYNDKWKVSPVSIPASN